ncbi:hypothetical protein [Bradyrhizobium sp. SEMIA]|uniref:hypothetical protein n=1 Tax=Bradyrhizobium sp. SEMIA TaxID=2597515 RepID=UPI0018A4CEA4|nr:hypothetical protein [Bradyrhizobium sp. SEMIA]QOG21710.1 hypothetical protein FOM02_34855 [Bradyrhizobium sp. SEMIA]
MVALRKQQNDLASLYGASVEATQKAHETFDRQCGNQSCDHAPHSYRREGDGVTPEQNAELMESMISQYDGVHFDTGEGGLSSPGGNAR